ncbi:MAG: DUF2085 domain-containing protein [Caldilineales bacterium]|nr:DUF2085 domain-containing protein [Caldilineales bacterium]
MNSQTPLQSGAGNRFVAAIDGFAAFIGKRWALVINVMILLYVGLPLLAPVLMNVGAELPARIIYTIYIPFCHQLPERSYFIGGDSLVYNISELPAGTIAQSDNIFLRRSYIGDHEHGYKTALCQRDIAIYGTMFIVALLFSLRRSRVPRLPFKFFVLMLIPIAVDGLSQLFGLRTSNWYLRTLTGVLFGLAVIWLAYPYLQQSFGQMSIKSSPSRRG